MAVVPRRSRSPEGVPQIHSMVHGNLKGSGLEVEAGTWDPRVRQLVCAVSPLSPARCRKMAPTRADNFTRAPNPESSNAASSSGRMRTLHQEVPVTFPARLVAAPQRNEVPAQRANVLTITLQIEGPQRKSRGVVVFVTSPDTTGPTAPRTDEDCPTFYWASFPLLYLLYRCYTFHSLQNFVPIRNLISTRPCEVPCCACTDPTRPCSHLVEQALHLI